jgi:hypothetical protein
VWHFADTGVAGLIAEGFDDGRTDVPAGAAEPVSSRMNARRARLTAPRRGKRWPPPPASVWEVTRTASGAIANLAKKQAYVNHCSFHIMDPARGHVTVKMSGHPPFPAQVILNGHEYVAATARAAGIGFIKEGSCFTGIADPRGLARVADTLSQPAVIGRLGQVCDRWIYTAWLCFGLDLAGQARSGFAYSYSIYQAEYSRNLLFASGAVMEDLFDRILDRTRSRLDIPTLRVLFGLKHRPHSNRPAGPPAQEIVIEKLSTAWPGSGSASGCSSSRPTPKASTSCAWRPPCTTPKNCAAAAAWTTSPSGHQTNIGASERKRNAEGANRL